MRPPALGYRLRAGLRAYGTSNVTHVKLLNQDMSEDIWVQAGKRRKINRGEQIWKWSEKKARRRHYQREAQGQQEALAENKGE